MDNQKTSIVSALEVLDSLKESMRKVEKDNGGNNNNIFPHHSKSDTRNSIVFNVKRENSKDDSKDMKELMQLTNSSNLNGNPNIINGNEIVGINLSKTVENTNTRSTTNTNVNNMNIKKAYSNNNMGKEKQNFNNTVGENMNIITKANSTNAQHGNLQKFGSNGNMNIQNNNINNPSNYEKGGSDYLLKSNNELEKKFKLSKAKMSIKSPVENKLKKMNPLQTDIKSSNMNKNPMTSNYLNKNVYESTGSSSTSKLSFKVYTYLIF